MANGGQAVSADELDEARADDAHAGAPATTGEGPILARADASPVPAQHTMTRERDGEEAAAVSSSELEEVADAASPAPLEPDAPAIPDAEQPVDGAATAEGAALLDAPHGAPPAGAPLYGPGHTLVGAPLFHVDDDVIGEPPSTNPMSAPTRPFDPASPEPAGRQRVTPAPVAGSAAVAPTSIEEEHGFPVPASSAPTTERDRERVGTNTAPLAFGPAQVVGSFGGVYPRVPPPPSAAIKPRRAKEGPSMVTIAAIAFLVIGGVTTGAMMLGRTRAGDSVLAPPATAPLARPTAPVSVPMEDAPATARPVSDAPPAKPVARPPTKRPWTRPAPSNPRTNPGKTSPSAPTATQVPPAFPSTQPPPAALPPQPQDPTGQPPQATEPSPSPTSSARRRRGQ
jgi:hypothetical protein